MAKQKSRASNESSYQIIQAGGTGTRNTRSTPFEDDHLLEFGLTISELKPNGGSVVAVACRFCTKFGREGEVGSKCKHTKNKKFFKAPFRPENYRNHLDGQHPSRWTEHNQLSLEGKRGFFDDVTRFRSSIRAYASESQAPIVVSIDIVDVIIEEVLLDNDDNDLAWVRNQNNEPLEGHIPPAFPRDLVKMKGRDLSVLINIHRDRMRVNWTDAEIDTIEQEHSTLSDQYEGQEQFRRIIDDTSPETKTVTTFEDDWKGIDGKFPMLCRFPGGLAITFPGTSTVESDFSLLKWENPHQNLD